MMAVMPPDPPRAALARPLADDPRRSYAAAALAVFAALLVAHPFAYPDASPSLWLPALCGYAAASLATAVLLGRHFPHSELGWCNIVTQIRLAIVALLATPLATGAGAGGWAVALFALAALALDGADGWLARRQGLCSGFGARFDMEVDAGLALVLALHALAAGSAGPVVLVLGLARYAFVAATFAAPWLAAPLPASRARKAVCVGQLATLIVLQAPFASGAATEALYLAAAAALAWSFGRDIRWLYRARERRAMA
jgi:phosphatidylglycerophosphate synthase